MESNHGTGGEAVLGCKSGQLLHSIARCPVEPQRILVSLVLYDQSPAQKHVAVPQDICKQRFGFGHAWHGQR
jgi:hypothetical protein